MRLGGYHITKYLDSEKQLWHRVAFNDKIFFLSILALVSEELPDVPCK